MLKGVDIRVRHVVQSIKMKNKTNIKTTEGANMADTMNIYKVSEELQDGTEIQVEYFRAMEDAAKFASDILKKDYYNTAEIRQHSGGYITERLIVNTKRGDLGKDYEVTTLARRDILVTVIEVN